MTLTPKQKKFCDYYIETGNASEAARRAGYSEKTARTIGQQNLAKRAIKDYISERMNNQDRERVASADEVIAFYTAVMRGEVKDQFGIEASLSDRLKAGENLMRRYDKIGAGEKSDGNSGVIMMPEIGGDEAANP